MDFKQKAEEKKMSMSKNIARLAVTAGLTAALSFGGVMAPVTMAFAAETGSIVTFNDPTYATSTTYKGIQIFTANVNGSTVTDIQWAGSSQTEKDAIRDAVVGAIDEAVKAEDATKSYSSQNAQDAAEWLNDHAGTTATTKVANGHVLNVIAKKLNLNASRSRINRQILATGTSAMFLVSVTLGINPINDANITSSISGVI